MHQTIQRAAEAYSKHYQTSKMEHFVKIIDSFQLFTIFTNSSILDF